MNVLLVTFQMSKTNWTEKLCNVCNITHLLESLCKISMVNLANNIPLYCNYFLTHTDNDFVTNTTSHSEHIPFYNLSSFTVSSFRWACSGWFAIYMASSGLCFSYCRAAWPFIWPNLRIGLGHQDWVGKKLQTAWKYSNSNSGGSLLGLSSPTPGNSSLWLHHN